MLHGIPLLVNGASLWTPFWNALFLMKIIALIQIYLKFVFWVPIDNTVSGNGLAQKKWQGIITLNQWWPRSLLDGITRPQRLGKKKKKKRRENNNRQIIMMNFLYFSRGFSASQLAGYAGEPAEAYTAWAEGEQTQHPRRDPPSPCGHQGWYQAS